MDRLSENSGGNAKPGSPGTPLLVKDQQKYGSYDTMSNISIGNDTVKQVKEVCDFYQPEAQAHMKHAQHQL